MAMSVRQRDAKVKAPKKSPSQYDPTASLDDDDDDAADKEEKEEEEEEEEEEGAVLARKVVAKVTDVRMAPCATPKHTQLGFVDQRLFKELVPESRYEP